MSETNQDSRQVDTSIDGPHFSADELRSALKRGFRTRQRCLEAILHFGGRCSPCWRSATELANMRARDRRIGSAVGRLTDPLDRATALAVSRLAATIGATQHPESVLYLRPAHQYWITGCKDHLGFFRIVLEELREIALGHPDAGVKVSQAIFEAIHRREPDADAEVLTEFGGSLKGLNEKWFHDFVALAHAHLGAACQLAGNHHCAWEQFEKAKAELARGGTPHLSPSGETSESSEVRATLLELKSDLARARCQPSRALNLAEEAQRLLSGLEEVMPGRQVETAVRIGVILMQLDRVQQAVRVLQEANEAMSGGSNPRLHFFALQHLAAAEVRAGLFDEAEEHLDQSEPLFESYSSGVTEAQRLFLRSVIGLRSKRPEECHEEEEMLRQAVERFQGLGLITDAVHALAHLGQFYFANKRREDLVATWLKYRQLLKTPEAQILRDAWLYNLEELAKRSGLQDADFAKLGATPLVN
ncbi:MAG: hypothetical protein GY856_37845 [bacterium]|nr:hypothetical protein [bacterium]